MKRERALLTELRPHITIPEYEFKDVMFFPLTKMISVAIFVKSKNCTILHSVKSTPQEIAESLNEQYERHLNIQTEQITLK